MGLDVFWTLIVLHGDLYLWPYDCWLTCHWQWNQSCPWNCWSIRKQHSNAKICNAIYETMNRNKKSIEITWHLRMLSSLRRGFQARSVEPTHAAHAQHMCTRCTSSTCSLHASLGGPHIPHFTLLVSKKTKEKSPKVDQNNTSSNVIDHHWPSRHNDIMPSYSPDTSQRSSTKLSVLSSSDWVAQESWIRWRIHC